MSLMLFSTTTTTDKIVTAGDIASTLGEKLARVRYVLDSRLDIQPLRRVGIVRIYSVEVVERVRSELWAIDHRRGCEPPT